MRIITTAEAADELGLDEATIRSMVKRSELKPLRPGARPLLFRAMDVIEAGARRVTKAQHDALDRLAARLACQERDDLPR